MFSQARLHIPLVFALLCCVTLLSGCAKPPTEEVAKAEKALEDAKAKEVNVYLEETFKKAEASLKKAKDLMVEKNYREAKPAAEEAASSLQLALSQVDAAKAKMKTEAEQMTQQVQAETSELKQLVAEAIRKQAAINREDALALIGKAEIDILNIKVRLETGKVRVAYDDLKVLKAEIAAQKEKILAVLSPGQEKK